jgi:hypothetical protein
VLESNTRQVQEEVGGLIADRQSLKATFAAALGPDFVGAARGAAQFFAWLLDAKEGGVFDKHLVDIESIRKEISFVSMSSGEIAQFDICDFPAFCADFCIWQFR